MGVYGIFFRGVETTKTTGNIHPTYGDSEHDPHVGLHQHMSSRLYLEKKGIACGWKLFLFKSTVPMGTR